MKSVPRRPAPLRGEDRAPPGIQTHGIDRGLTAVNGEETEFMAVGGNRARRWTPTQQPSDCFPSFTIAPKLLPLL
jgi:hypothetical protein